MKILITGGIGFIGSSLVYNIYKEHDITIFDIRDNNKGFKIYDILPVKFIQGDINNIDLLYNILNEGFDCIIHLCAVSRVVVAEQNPDECIRVNINGTDSLLKAIQVSKSSKAVLIFGSSREVYGNPTYLPVTEDFEYNPVNIYGKSKVYGEKAFIEYSYKHGNPCGILRFSNVYGNEYDLYGRVIPRFIINIYKDEPVYIEGGNQLIDFTYIDDVIWGINACIEYLTANNVIDIFHILPGVKNTLYDVISAIENTLNKKAKVFVNPKREYDVEKFIGNPEKILKYFGDHKFYTIQEGIPLAIPKYIKNL
ncbi:MAG: NAD(P)-dependent oxidoreductase [Mucispirillum sp.]|uniref:NAD(P)-dependent oxidoreductase n=1 Tax=Candidatus Mucispirillum faecigallinarum TaxID=2838699 RepID=A0A9D2KCJ1_9BACT|nr:NAD(P)-dependent oxidoreductase [Mucispirillum sp.]HIZ90186.1 NAD(P)-dependent oxidoreductase [Candidatus Mucispirillum faecigallinarum]